eukprot:978884-Rhodomonas_salina.5
MYHYGICGTEIPYSAVPRCGVRLPASQHLRYQGTLSAYAMPGTGTAYRVQRMVRDVPYGDTVCCGAKCRTELVYGARRAVLR